MFIPATSPSLLVKSTGQANSKAAATGISIEIGAGEDNVSSGDRSNNTAELSVTTPNRQVSAEISREQVVNGLESRSQQQAISQLTSANGRQGSNPLTRAALLSSDISGDDLSDIATIRRQRQLLNTYVNATPQNNNTSLNNDASNNATSANKGGSLYNNAVDAYVKQTLFFSGLDKATSGFSTKA